MAIKVEQINVGGGLLFEGRRAALVVPHASTNIVREPALIYVGATGDITVETTSGDVVQFKNVPVGWLGPILVKRVNATGTTATLMVSISA